MFKLCVIVISVSISNFDICDAIWHMIELLLNPFSVVYIMYILHTLLDKILGLVTIW